MAKGLVFLKSGNYIIKHNLRLFEAPQTNL
jgi:hypothetical protein